MKTKDLVETVSCNNSLFLNNIRLDFSNYLLCQLGAMLLPIKQLPLGSSLPSIQLSFLTAANAET